MQSRVVFEHSEARRQKTEPVQHPLCSLTSLFSSLSTLLPAPSIDTTNEGHGKRKYSCSFEMHEQPLQSSPNGGAQCHWQREVNIQNWCILDWNLNSFRSYSSPFLAGNGYEMWPVKQLPLSDNPLPSSFSEKSLHFKSGHVRPLGFMGIKESVYSKHFCFHYSVLLWII